MRLPTPGLSDVKQYVPNIDIAKRKTGRQTERERGEGMGGEERTKGGKEGVAIT